MEIIFQIIVIIAITILCTIVLWYILRSQEIRTAKNMKYRAYKCWLYQNAHGKVSEIANIIYNQCKDGHELPFELIKEKTQDRFFTSKTYVKTAKAVYKDVKLLEKYGL